jgi:hypothetical protein
VLTVLFAGIAISASADYVKVSSFKDIGQSRAFFIAFKGEVPTDNLEDALWEIVDYHMNKYGQAPQMWIYFFDTKKNAPKDFPIQGESLKHLLARYFYATDTRKKDLKILSDADRAELQVAGGIGSPLWTGQ